MLQTPGIQNRAGGIITFSGSTVRSADILRDLRRDTLEERRSKQLAITVFKSLNNLYPESFKELFQTNLQSSFPQRTSCLEQYFCA